MKLKNILIIIVAVIVVAVLAIFAAMGSVVFDVMSYTATGHQTLSPAGAVTGKALVVYNPGISGQAKGVAAKIAGDLQADGYSVDLCGIRSADAGKTAGYDVIVVGGPVYMGNASSSVQSYLKTLTPDSGAKIGAFATGQDPDVRNSPDALRKEVAPLPADSTLRINAVTKIVYDNESDSVSAAFVKELLQ